MSKDLIAFRCPSDLLEAIENQTDATGESKTAVIVNMLRHSVPSLLITERNKLPKVPAVYLVFTPSNRLLYVGQTNNLYSRWGSHHRYQRFIEASPDSRVAWFEIDPTTQNGIEIETELIESFEPEFNRPLAMVYTNIEMSKKLATFRIEEDLWNQFQEKVAANKTNASAVLIEFIERFLAGEIAISNLFINADIEKRIEHLEASLEETNSNTNVCIDGCIDKKLEQYATQESLSKLQQQLVEVVDRLKKLESLRAKAEALRQNDSTQDALEDTQSTLTDELPSDGDKQAQEGISGAELAKRLGVNPSAISRWKKGDRKPSGDQAVAFGKWEHKDGLWHRKD